jgi:hypothetical protein
MTQAPTTTFGRYVAFGAACASDPREPLPQTALDGLLVLESLRMVYDLHQDLHRSALGDQEWGCDTVGLVLADALNAQHGHTR